MTGILQLGGTTREESDNQATVISSEDVVPDLFDGTANLGNSWGLGSAKLMRGAAMAGAVVPVAYDYLFDNDTQAQNWYFRNVVEDPYNSAKDYYHVDSRTMGSGAQVLGGLVEMLPQMVGGGASLTGSMYMNAATDAVEQGVDAETARGVGAIQGIAAGVGVWMPMVGKTLTGKVLGNAALNPLVGMAARGATGTLLESQGYTEQAKQYDAFDMQAITLDAITGAVFGGMSKLSKRQGGSFEDVTGIKYERLPTRVKDSIAAARSFSARMFDSMPGKPANLKAQVKHMDAADKAITQLANGEPVRVADIMDGAEFVGPRQMEMDVRAIDENAEALEWVNDEPLPDAPVIKAEPVETPAPKKGKAKAEKVEPVDPDILRMRQAIMEHGDFELEVERVVDPNTGEISVKKMKASDVVKETEKMYKQSEELAEAVKVASNCYLGNL